MTTAFYIKGADYWQWKNEEVLKNATKFRIVPINTSSKGKGYVGEAYVQTDVTEGTWHPLKGTFSPYHCEANKWGPSMEYAYNRCKKVILKLQNIKLNNLISESGYAAFIYGNIESPDYIPSYTEKEIFKF